MRFVLTIAICMACVVLSTATPLEKLHRRARDIPAWVAAGPTDCRSPCPGLNTLANHGYLPHDGQNLDFNSLKQVLVDVFGLTPTFGLVFAHAASNKFAAKTTGKFSLCDLLTNIHSTDQPSGATGIEHTASLTREDRPDWLKTSNPSQRSPSTAQISLLTSSSSDGKMITMADFLKARVSIWNKSYNARPALKQDSLDNTEHIIAAAEGCLLLGVLSGNSNAGSLQISKAYAESILIEERLPVGWVKSSKPMGVPEFFGCLVEQGLSWAANEVTGVLTLAEHWFALKV